MEEIENIDLGINPSKINPTEERLAALVLTLKKHPTGLSSSKIKELLPRFYDSNLAEDSFLKKLQRDIDALQELGFVIQTLGKEGQKKIYKLETPIEVSKVQFTREELGILSIVFSQESLEELEYNLYTAFQKIFHKNMNYFPFQVKLKDLQQTEENKKILEQILLAIRNKIPLKITYYKNFIEEKVEKEIDPIHITKRNHIDSYLIAYDRKEKQRKRFHLSKILKCQEISSVFLFNYSISEDDKNYHALNFKIHEPIEITLKVNPQNEWKLKIFLEPHPFIKKGNEYVLKVTNLPAMFSFIWRYEDVVLEMSPESLYMEYKKYLQKILKLYEDEEDV